jgi:predicted nucleic acid-binding protein
LSLAVELQADLVLVDERRAYRAALALRLDAAGTIALLEWAARLGMLDLAEAFARLKETDFWISHRLLDERLARYRR